MKDYLKYLEILREQGIEFVIVGGVAVILHGVNRATFDLDIVPDLNPDSWRKLIDLVWESGARPRIPETHEAIRDVENVKHWMIEKNLLALTFRSPSGGLDIDLLVAESASFQRLRDKAHLLSIGEQKYSVIDIDDLIAMKKAAGRSKDLDDVAELERIKIRRQAYIDSQNK